jgi:hypothetical protein
MILLVQAPSSGGAAFQFLHIQVCIFTKVTVMQLQEDGTGGHPAYLLLLLDRPLKTSSPTIDFVRFHRVSLTRHLIRCLHLDTKSSTSPNKSSGCSRAAKWPPCCDFSFSMVRLDGCTNRPYHDHNESTRDITSCSRPPEERTPRPGSMSIPMAYCTAWRTSSSPKHGTGRCIWGDCS